MAKCGIIWAPKRIRTVIDNYWIIKERIYGSKMILKRKQSSFLQNVSEHAEGMTEFEKHNFTTTSEIIDMIKNYSQMLKLLLVGSLLWNGIFKQFQCTTSGITNYKKKVPSVQKSGGQNLNQVIKLNVSNNGTAWHYVQWKCHDTWSLMQYSCKKMFNLN